MAQHFFESFFGPQQTQEKITKPEYINYNEIILEITNNWDHANDLIIRYKQGKLQEVDQLEHTWYQFLIGNNIDITIYKNKEEFFDKFWKVP
jgi:hypothetical protein